MAKKLEATEEEIIHAMHPHPTYSEAIMEAAGQGLGSRCIFDREDETGLDCRFQVARSRVPDARRM